MHASLFCLQQTSFSNWTLLKNPPSPVKNTKTKRDIWFWMTAKVAQMCVVSSNDVTVSLGWIGPDSLSLWVSSLRYDPGKLHLSAGVHLKPVVSFLWLCAPRTAIQVIIIFRTLQLTTALFRTSLSSWLENKFWPQPRHYPNFPNQCWARWKVMFTCMLSRPRWAEKPWWDWEEASSWSSSTRWDSRPSGGQSWKNKMFFMELIY